MVEQAFRGEWGRVLASLVGFLGDIDLDEDAAQEAFAIASERWPREGTPANPVAWLMTTARNRAIDRIRRERTLAAKTQLMAASEAVEDDMDEADEPSIPDERLELIFTCCHPALTLESQVALTLRTLGGLTTDEIARALLVQESAMRRQLARAKRKIRDAGIPFRVPEAHVLPERLAAVLGVIYLIFNQGHAGDDELSGEAIRLGRLITCLMPDEPEAHGLLALMRLHHGRRAARFAGGELVLLDDQDRSLWDRQQIEQAHRDLDRALALRGRGTYVLQAAIASLHLAEPRDWQQIVLLYDELAGLTRSPVVEVNRAIAIAQLRGPTAGLALLDRLDLDGYQYVHSTRGELLRRAGEPEAARTAFARALELAPSGPERRFLERRLRELDTGTRD